ncbi:NADH-quinone oxidoreductase subunit NuoN [Salinibacillus xinjiangensis]|uniref:NADH-quinone oxidoreductase subunit N n=1 Tax=Salinibacillus xinjiangensis TaxID=1229268 RepID=A0A6G1X5A3_9BACI|nr:NADH-quinone oxidoreductase subunit NuoN [Salinibacillus xinjiangensis]MRG86181.1 NADH-quinone oxidoreductase subunit NuoN [Salinibacillus xinjiangensis]
MDIQTLLSFEWGMMAPEFTILIVGILLSLLDLFGKDTWKKSLPWLAVGGVGVAIIFLLFQYGHGDISILGNTYVFDSFAFYFKLILLIATLLILLMVISRTVQQEVRDRGEYLYLLLAALLGGMMVASGGDLISLFVGLELLSLSSYIMVGLRKRDVRSSEGAMKYLINGSIATAFTLFGMSYVFGLTGSTKLVDIAREMSGSLGSGEPVAIIGFIIMFVGLAFKISTVPFHMWTPDVYEGAVTPVSAFLSVVSKSAGFIIIVRIFWGIFGNATFGGSDTLFATMIDFIAVLAFLTMFIGNLVALRQRNMKRLLAYSSIGHAGYILIPLVSLTPVSLENIWFYLLAYAFMTIGAFMVIYILEQQKQSEDISIFTGLYRESPALAIIMTIFLASLAGIPGTAGFIGKFNIFVGAVAADPAQYILAGTMAVMTVVSYIYYFNIMVQMYIRKPQLEGTTKIARLQSVPLILCVAGTIGLGVFPFIALNFFH